MSTAKRDASTSPEAAEPPQRRQRTEEQWDRKRMVDRMKQRKNRHENKMRMDHIETSIERIQASLQTLTEQLQHNINVRPPPQSVEHQQAPNLSPGLSPGSAAAPPPPASSDNLHGRSQSLPGPAGQSFHPNPGQQGFDGALQQIWGQTRDPASDVKPALLPPVFDCRCGIDHSQSSDCLEHHTSTILFQTHIALLQSTGPRRNLPRNPSLPGFATNDEGPVVSFISSVLRSYHVKDTQTLFGCYLMGYRLLRWRLYPDKEASKDVPSWLLTTNVQDTYPHPVTIDFLPWPELRNYLCTHQNRDLRHCVKLYIESLRLNCPPATQIFALGVERPGQLSMSKEFEDIVVDLRNWTLGAPFSDTFPQLMKFVHP